MVYFGHQRWQRLNPQAVVREIPPPDKNDSLVLWIKNSPKHLNPLKAVDPSNERILALIYESLLSINSSGGQPELRLAESFKTIDDGLIYEFKLRENVLFHDSKPLTTADVLYTFIQMKGQIANLSTVTLTESNAIRFKFKDRRFTNLLSVGLVPIVPKHIFETEEFQHHSLNYSPIGTGPYVFSQWDSKTAVDLKLNTKYWGAKVEPWRRRFNFNRIRFLIIPNEALAFDAFKNQALDMMEIESELHWQLFDDREFNKKVHHLNFEKRDGGGYSGIGWNLLKPPFDTKEVRVALAHALDRREIDEKFFHGQRRLAVGPFSINSLRSDKHISQIPFNLNMATQRLANLGWLPDPRNGNLIKDDKALAFEIIYDRSDLNAPKILAHYQEELHRIGIQMTPQPVDRNQMNDLLKAGTFDAFFIEREFALTDNPSMDWHSNQIPPAGSNFVRFHNPRVDKILTDAQFSIDPEAQNKLYQELQSILIDEVPFIFIFENSFYVLVQTRFEKVLPIEPLGLDISKWFTLPGKEKYKE